MTEQRDSAVTAAELDAMRVYAHEATKAITSLVGGGSECFGRELHGIFTADLPYCVGRIRDRIDASAEGEINARRALAALRRERDGWKANCQAQLEETHRHMADNAKKDAALREMKGWLTEADIVALSDDTRDTLAALAPAAQGEKKCALHENDCCGADGPDCPYDATELAAMDRSAPAPSAGETVLDETQIDALRLMAFKTNSEADRAAYFQAVSKWFQDRHYRALAADPTTGETVRGPDNEPTIWCSTCSGFASFTHDHRPDNSGLDDGPYLPGHEPRKKAAPKSPEEMAAIRAKAWATRRAAAEVAPCAKCGYPRGEHHYNGLCYGLCGEFLAAAPTTGETP